MKREFKQIIKMIYCVQKALRKILFIEFYDWGISCGMWDLLRTFNFSIKRGRKKEQYYIYCFSNFPYWIALKRFYLEADHEADQGQRNLNLSCTCMCNTTAERLRAKLIRSFLSWARNGGVTSVDLCYRKLHPQTWRLPWLELSIALLFVSTFLHISFLLSFHLNVKTFFWLNMLIMSHLFEVLCFRRWGF